MTQNAIEIKNVSLQYRLMQERIDSLKDYALKYVKNQIKHEDFYALRNIGFSVAKGERIGIIGPNGAGKSTLLKLIAGVMKPSEGQIEISGSIAPLLELGAGFDPEFSGKDNIFLNAALLGKNKEQINKKYDEIVSFAGLGRFLYVPIKNYSTGMRAKLGFSIATQTEPDILLIDEVLGVGDEKFKRKCVRRINTLMKEGRTVVVVSHNLQQIRQLTERVIWLEDGMIVMEGETDNVVRAYEEHMNTEDSL